MKQNLKHRPTWLSLKVLLISSISSGSGIPLASFWVGSTIDSHFLSTIFLTSYFPHFMIKFQMFHFIFEAVIFIRRKSSCSSDARLGSGIFERSSVNSALISALVFLSISSPSCLSCAVTYKCLHLNRQTFLFRQYCSSKPGNTLRQTLLHTSAVILPIDTCSLFGEIENWLQPRLKKQHYL